MTREALHMRIARLEDAERLRAHMEAINREELPWFRGPEALEPEAFRAALETGLAHPMSTVAVGEAGGEIVALGFVEQRGDAHADVQISVAATHRGRGYGQALLEFLIGWARGEAGLERLYGKVLETNLASVRLCQSLGFREDHERTPRAEQIDGRQVRVLQLYLDVG